MTLDPILNAPWVIQIHIAFAMPAILLGPVAIYRRRRDAIHRAFGYAWVTAMTGVAITGLFIPAAILPILGPFGPIHGLSVVVLVNLVLGIRHIRHRRIAAHQAVMRSLYWQAMGIAGLFTLLPGRTMNATLFPGAPELGWWAIGAGLLAIAAMTVRNRRPASA